MKAAYLTSPYELCICERPMPRPKDDEVLIAIKATAICGTDVSIYKGGVPLAGPVIQGHESAGVIVEKGRDVTGFDVDDPVIINPAYFCGHCFYCVQGLENMCENGGLLGRDKDGTFAEYLAISPNALVKLPGSISFEDASTLQSVATILRGWERMEAIRPIRETDTVVVLGLGTPGLLNVRMSVLSGAKNVFAMTRSQWKLDIAQSFGGTPVNPATQNLKELVAEATNGRGADVVIECAGSARTFQEAFDIARPGGTILPFGILHSMDKFDGYNYYFKELTVIGTRAMNIKGYKRAVTMYEDGAFDLKPLITDRFTLEETKANFDKMDQESGKHLRMVCLI